jgi:primosomal protein N'
VVRFYAGLVSEALGKGQGAIVVVPEVREGSEVIERLASEFGDEVAVVHSGLDPGERSKALWEVALGRKRVVLGGRAAVFAPPFPLGVLIVHAEHDRSLKEQRGPYYDAREVALARGAVTGAEVVFGSHTPSLTTLYRGGGWEVVEPERAKERVGWPVVEVVERPKVGMPRRAVAAIIEARRLGVRTIVLLPRARATRAGPGPREVARFLGRVVPGASIALADRPDLGGEPGKLRGALEADVIVATEAALAEIERPPVGCAIALGVDTLFSRPLGRAVEDAFETLWSLALLIAGRQPRARFIVETADPTHHVVQALTRGDYRFFADHELELREEDESPPFVRLVRLKLAGQPSGETLDALNGVASGARARVLGPAPGAKGVEMLIKAPDIEVLAGPLCEVVARVPERILVEVDPREW